MIEFIHFITIALAITLPVLGLGIGQGITSIMALRAINQQPAARADITRTVVLGVALIETAAIMGLFVALMMITQTNTTAQNWYGELAKLGIALAICVPGFVLGLASAFPAGAACMAVARQPFLSQKINRFMLITLSLIQTPIIFGFVIALAIQSQINDAVTLRDSLRLIGAGLSIGLGSVGPALGLATFAKSACTALGINRSAYNKIFSFTLVSEAIIETPIIFALVISLMLVFLIPATSTENVLEGIAFLCAALCTGIGTVGPGLSSGRTAAAACDQIALYPDEYSVLSRASMFAQGLIETSAIYAVLIGFALIFYVTK